MSYVNDPSGNLAQVGNSLESIRRLMHQTQQKLKGLSEEELEITFVMAYRARKQLNRLTEELNRFDQILDAHLNPNAEGTESMVEWIKGRFRK